MMIKETVLKRILETGTQVHPNLISRWKAEFIEKTPAVFSKDNSEADKHTRV
ncbi:MAG: hypothetical protein ABFD18_07055 [Syntrophomonas sp.]